jgi:hypothetical protein
MVKEVHVRFRGMELGLCCAPEALPAFIAYE